MSTTTPNLGLFKYDPSTDGAQTFNIQKALNENWDKVDAAVKNLSSAAEYSAAQTYALGDYCTHDGKLYRCTTAITEAEAWTDAHWTETSVSAELKAIYKDLQKKADYDFVVNPNLLDNPWFTVNQRGVSGSISTAGYFLDRWKKRNNAGTIGITNDGITWTFDSSDDNDIDQLFENPSEIGKGTKVTFSVLVDGNVYSVPFNWLETNGINVNGLSGMQIFSLESRHLIIRFTSSWESSRVIRAVKLEKGEISTLANDIPPNYAQELAKCQRYFQIIPRFGTYGVANWSSDVEVHYKMPTTMRTKPAAIIPSKLTNALREMGNKDLTPTSIAFSGSYYISTESVFIDVVCSGLTIGKAYSLDIPIQLTADL